MKWALGEDKIRIIFDASVILKGLHAASELVGGVALLFVSPSLVLRLATALTADELAEDPNDPFSNYLMHAAKQFSVPFQHIAALYLVSHGLVVGFLVAGLLAKKLWAYPASVAVLMAFIAYQGYQYALHPSWWLAAVTVLDAAVVLLTLHEYRYIKSQRSAAE
ncbi:MAG: DUF2127 domain-containing protein [Patescibacteria group bacterium]|nr:DUF2127 domain-containing protein [Patescibacteria group bacterium]